jgi:hypothetical protein
MMTPAGLARSQKGEGGGAGPDLDSAIVPAPNFIPAPNKRDS